MIERYFILLYFIKLLYLFIFLSLSHLACEILVPLPGMEPVLSAVEAQSINHWSTRDIPRMIFKSNENNIV